MPLTNDARLRRRFALVGVWIAGAFLFACSGPAPESSSPSPEVEPGARIYHVQIGLTEDKNQANELLVRAERWWSTQPSSDRPPRAEGLQSSDPPVTITWKAPFYRVRLGPFATEKQAEAVLKVARSSFPDAFVAPGRAQSAPQE